MTARLPSLNGLRAFEAAARHLSFTVAASELNVTQTAISHQIRRLEEELGIRLFVRQNRALALTPEARDYLPGVRAAFNDLRLATDRLKRRDDDHVLTVSTLASLAAKWLLPRLSTFQEAHPGIDVRITTSTSLVDFRSGDVDAAIRYGRDVYKRQVRHRHGVVMGAPHQRGGFDAVGEPRRIDHFGHLHEAAVEPADRVGDRAFQLDLARRHRAGAELVLQAHDPVVIGRTVVEGSRHQEQADAAGAAFRALRDVYKRQSVR